MQPIPYLFFPGTCAEAMRAYARLFDAPEPEIMWARDAEGAMEGMDPDHVLHAALRLGEGWIYASDGAEAASAGGTAVAVSGRDEAETRRWWGALAEGATVEMPLAATFWSPLFGALTDRWGRAG